MSSLSIILISVGCGLIAKGLGLTGGTTEYKPTTVKVEMDRWERVKLAEALRRD